jgi:FtsP/CotA-like multicopper oxidase with cupredoxin domain
MADKQTAMMARVGDWIESRGLHGQPSRRGEIVELLGSAGHEHYRVRWDEQHESIVYPADGVIIAPQAKSLGALADESD